MSRGSRPEEPPQDSARELTALVDVLLHAAQPALDADR
ncbi:hypothetical protein ACVWWH_003920 [Sinomonas sp. RB5]